MCKEILVGYKIEENGKGRDVQKPVKIKLSNSRVNENLMKFKSGIGKANRRV